MLVVTRKKDEKLIIGNEIEIQVLRIGRDNVRLGQKRRQQMRRRRRPLRKFRAIRDRNSHHLADDRRRNGQRKIGDHIHRAALEDAVDLLRDDLLGARAKPLGRARPERNAHELAKPRMVRRVLLQDETARHGAVRCRRGSEDTTVGKADTGRHLAKHPHDIVVTGQPPEADRSFVYGIVVSQTRKQRVRIVLLCDERRKNAEPRIGFPRFVGFFGP